MTEGFIREKLPKIYGAYGDVFLKIKSDKITPYRAYDYKIIMADEQLPSREKGALYHLFLKKLDMIREYLQKHLNREWIMPSKAAYMSPVLFAPKPGEGWRFCVNYRKFNKLIKKN